MIVQTVARVDTDRGADARTATERLGRLADPAEVVDELLRSTGEVAAVTARTTVAERVPHVSVTALGAARIQVDDRPLTAADFGYAKPRELLYFLMDREDATKDQIGLALWPWASSTRLRSSFHTTLHHLRSALPADRVVFTDGRYRFDRSRPFAYDVKEFESLTAVTSSTAGPSAVDDLGKAVELYRGDYLNELVGERWIDERRDELRRRYERTLLSLARLKATTGHYDDAIELLHRAISHDPLSESVHRELMRCYASAGRRGSALRQYKTLSTLLRDELSTSPTAETSELQVRIRRGDAMAGYQLD